MTHGKMLMLVSSYLDGEVDAAEKDHVLAHLHGCSECREFINHAKRMRRDIRSLDEVKLSNSFSLKVAHAVEERQEHFDEWLGIEPLARNTFITLALAVVVMFFFSVYSSKGESTMMGDKFINVISGDSLSTYSLLQQENISKNDILYASVTK
jgi:predicted anti-sigma-YlaC factor YlaD